MKIRHSGLAPRGAQLLLSIIAGPKHREAVMGDLQEEYHAQFIDADKPSKYWYWKEVARAIPGLLILRLATISFRAIGQIIVLTVGGYALLFLWGRFITRPTMTGIIDSNPDIQTADYMVFYLPIRILGILLVSAAISFFAFRKEISFKHNFSRYLIPLLMLISLPQIFTLITAPANYSLSTGILILALDSLALVSGAILGLWLKGRKAPK